MTALLHDLTRPELDELIHLAEHADRIAGIALRNAPLDREGAVEGAAGVAVDCMALAYWAREESLMRWLEGEHPADESVEGGWPEDDRPEEHPYG